MKYLSPLLLAYEDRLNEKDALLQTTEVCECERERWKPQSSRLGLSLSRPTMGKWLRMPIRSLNAFFKSFLKDIQFSVTETNKKTKFK